MPETPSESNPRNTKPPRGDGSSRLTPSTDSTPQLPIAPDFNDNPPNLDQLLPRFQIGNWIKYAHKDRSGATARTLPKDADYEHPDVFENDPILEAPLSVTDKEALGQFQNAVHSPLLGGRQEIHLVRLLSRRHEEESGVERSFAYAFMKYYPNRGLAEKEKSYVARSHFRAIWGGEGLDVHMAWTLSPYIYRALLLRGAKEQDAMNAVFDWSLTGEVHNEMISGSHHSLAGLQEVNSQFEDDWANYFTLGANPHGESHRAAWEIANILIDNGFIKQQSS